MTLRRESELSVAESLTARESDIVWSVRWRNRRLYVLVLIEFQSSVDRWLALRQLTYVALFYQKLVQSGRVAGRKRLPPVLPVVVYNGARRWTAPTRVEDLVELPSGDVQSLLRYQPRFEFILLDEQRMAVDLSETRDLVRGIAALEQTQDPDDLLSIVVRLADWLDEASPERRAFAAWLNRILLPKRLLAADGTTDDLLELRSMLAERVEQWRRDARAKDRRLERLERTVEDLENSAETTARQTAAEILRRLAMRKFGPFDGAVERLLETRLSTADVETIERWSERLLFAKTLDETFAEPA